MKSFIFSLFLCSFTLMTTSDDVSPANAGNEKSGGPLYRERISINDGWKFFRYTGEPDKLIYDERPAIINRNDNIVADTRAADSALANSSDNSLKKWILPTANDFIKDPANYHQRPVGNPGSDFP